MKPDESDNDDDDSEVDDGEGESHLAREVKIEEISSDGFWIDEKVFTYDNKEYRKTLVDGKHAVYMGDEVVWRDLCKCTLRGHSGTVFSCSFSPDGASVLSGSDDKTLKIWDAATGARL